jgi:uncharacterized protein
MTTNLEMPHLISPEQPVSVVSLRDSTWRNKWLLGAGLFLAAWYLLRFVGYEWIAEWPTVVVLLVTGVAPTVFMLLFPFLTRDGKSSSRFRISGPKRWLVELAIAAAVVIASMTLLGIFDNLVSHYWPGKTIVPTAIDSMARTGSPRYVYAFLIASFTLAPLAEEVFFRGFLFNALRRRLPIVVACVIQAILFGFGHRFGTMHAAIASVGGILLALVYEWRKTLIAPILVHAGINVVCSIAMLGLMADYADGPMLGVFGGPDENICLVSEVVTDSPASQAGILVGDRIVSFDGEPIVNFRGLRSLIATKQPGDTVSLTFIRDDKTMETTVTLGRRGDPSDWK